MRFVVLALYFVILLVVTFGISILARKYVYSKIRVNKYVPLGIAIALLLVQLFLGGFLAMYSIWIPIALIIVTVLFFLWFMDIVSTGGPKKKEKKIVIKPKAKPNRVKHLKDNDKK